MSTYINALYKAGFCIEQLIEQKDGETMRSDDDSPKINKAKMMPLSFCIKAKKL